MNAMNMKIQERCLNSLYLKVKAIAIIHLNISKSFENLIIMHTWILFRKHGKFCENNLKKWENLPYVRLWQANLKSL